MPCHAAQRIFQAGKRSLLGLKTALVAILLIVTLGATSPSARYDQDSHKMMCMCGCDQLLGECNHMGCPDSPAMLAQLQASIDKGESDNAIFHDFERQYGPVVLAAPMFTRFNHLAWIVPPLVLFLGIGGVMLAERKWKFHSAPLPPAHRVPGDEAIRQRIRRETEL